jgi:hypothetical protein
MRTRSTLLLLIGFSLVLSYAARVEATEISDVTVSNVTQSSANVTWTTDVGTDATVNYGLDSSVGIIRDPSFDALTHTLTIPNLSPATTYHFRASSVDKSGNVSATGGFVFTTSGSSADKAVTAIKELTKPEDIIAASKALQSVASDVLKPPTVLGAAKVIPDVTSAEIVWTTDRSSGSVVHMEPDGTYDAGSSDPYTITQGDAGESVTTHDVTVIGLDPNTKYHFKVASIDSYNLTGETADDTFTTKAAVPEVQHVVLSNVSETVATINWSTGSVLASGNVDFINLRTHKTLSMGDPAFLTKHSVELTGLVFGTTYSVIIHATNQSGDVASSKPLTFTTVRDTVPPVISKVTNQSTLFPSDNVEVQTIITWKTDEPAFCQLFYLHGVVRSANNPPSSEPVEQNPLTDHTEVMVGLSPASVYKFWVACHDAANNPSQSEDYVLITPDKQKNIVDVILQNFQGTFGWVNNIGK